MSLTAGARIGSYEIVSALGAGGMGEVYRATDTHLKRQVAIKVLPASLAADPDRLARFQREAEVLAALNHPHIAAIYGLEKTSDFTALVMELVDGDDLSERIAHLRAPGASARPAGLPLDEALAIAKQIAEALEAAHEQGIVHRDLKPANIKVRADGTVKVLDFGLAKAVEQGSGIRDQGSGSPSISPTLTSPALMTGVGVILGTAAYMAPEQAKGRPVDKRADVWAFGAVLYEMLTGTRAFAGEDVTDTIVSVMSRDPDWNALPEGLPPAAHLALRRCLQKDRKQRFGDMQSVRLALEGAFESAVPPTVSMTAPAAPRGRVAWLVAAAAIVGMTAFAVPAVRHLREQPQPADTLVRFNVAAPRGARMDTYHYSVAPDGQTLAFGAVGGDGVSRLFVRRLDATAAQPVAGTDGAKGPFWSPDSRSLGFAREGGLYRVALDGSAPRRLCDVPSGGSGFGGGTWSARGVIVFAMQTGLQQVPDTGGSPTPVTTLDTSAKEALHRWPRFLPDGRHVLFLALADGQTRGTVWAAAIDDATRTRITESSGGVAYTAGWLLSTTESPRTLIAQPFDPARLVLSGAPQLVRDDLNRGNTGGFASFSASSNGVLVVDHPPSLMSELVWLDRSGRTVSTVSARAALSEFALAPDERRIAAVVSSSDRASRALWLFDGVRPEGTQLTYERAAARPVWARDGRHVYFTGANFTLRTVALGAGASTAFEQPGPFVHFEDVTSDGKYVVFKSLSVPSQVWLQRIGTEERRALVQGQFAATRPRVSPDSRWLAYTLELPSGPEVFAQPFDRPGDRIQVSVKGGIGPVWRDDGRELYYETPAGLMVVSTTDRGDALEVGTPQRLFAVRTQGGVPNQPHNFEVAEHGQKFLVNTIVDDSDNVPLEVTLHWDAGLTK